MYERTILVVEDDANDVLLLKRAFKKVSPDTPLEIVRDGEEAVSYLSGEGEHADRGRHSRAGLVLLDLKLPKMSGLEVLEWMRGQAGLRRLPVVVLTSSGEAGDVNRAYDLGASSYMVKPVSFDDLLKMVRAIRDYWLMLSQLPEAWSAGERS